MIVAGLNGDGYCHGGERGRTSTNVKELVFCVWLSFYGYSGCGPPRITALLLFAFTFSFDEFFVAVVDSFIATEWKWQLGVLFQLSISLRFDQLAMTDFFLTRTQTKSNRSDEVSVELITFFYSDQKLFHFDVVKVPASFKDARPSVGQGRFIYAKNVYFIGFIFFILQDQIENNSSADEIFILVVSSLFLLLHVPDWPILVTSLSGGD